MHPLEPLSAGEFRQAAAILRREHGVSERWRFASIELKEHAKGVETPPREAIVVCWNRADGAAYRAVVSLAEDRTLSWDALDGIQPNLTPDEWHECDAALRREPRLIEALAKRGITDMELVLIDVWGYRGYLVPEQWSGRRLGWTDTWFRTAPGSNPYANPVNGLHCVVDLNSMELLEIEDSFDVDRPQIMGEYVPKFVPDLQHRHVTPIESRSPKASASRSKATRCRGRTGPCGSASTTAKGSCCTRSPTPAAPSRIASRSPRWSSPTATPRPITSAARRTTSASGGSAS